MTRQRRLARVESRCSRWHSHCPREALHFRTETYSDAHHLPLFSSPLDTTLTGEAHFSLAVPHGSFQPPVILKIPRLSCSGYPRSQVARPTTRCEGPHSRGRWYRLRTSYAYPVLTPHGLPHDKRFRLFAVKNVVLAGFGHITLLDLDTIDLSNLNRQFLFRKKDVKQSKALVRRPRAPSSVPRSYRVPAFPSGGGAHSIRI